MSKIINDKEFLTYDDVLIRPSYSEVRSRVDVDCSTNFMGLELKTPIMSANMQSVNTIKLITEVFNSGGISTIDQFRSIESQVDIYSKVNTKGAEAMCAIGVKLSELERLEALFNAGARYFVIDTPHAHSILTKELVHEIRKKYSDVNLVVGNIATSEAAKFLCDLGVDGIKVGIGPGSSCLTRINTGAGAPQLSAVMEVAQIAQKRKIPIIADGGIKKPGDVSKAIAAGASAVYIGNLFAGTSESPGKLIEKNGKKYKEYFGSSSSLAKQIRSKLDPKYKEDKNRFVEGEVGLVPFSGTVSGLVSKLEMGLRSAMSYAGAKSIKEFQQKAKLTKISLSGLRENGAHGLII